jgi:hypothetical protein
MSFLDPQEFLDPEKFLDRGGAAGTGPDDVSEVLAGPHVGAVPDDAPLDRPLDQRRRVDDARPAARVQVGGEVLGDRAAVERHRRQPRLRQRHEVEGR